MLENPFENIVNFRKKTRYLAIALTLLLSLSAAIAVIPSAIAHTPPWEIPTYAYVTAAPNPVGVSQTVVIIFWLDIPPPTAGSPITGDRWQKMAVDIVKPDGKAVHYTNLISDPVGSGFVIYTPDIAGTYNVTFSFPGQVLKLTHPVSGLAGSQSNYINDTYLASRATTSFVVQDEPVAYFEEAPFPKSYWTRPINENNQQWTAIASNWLGNNGNAALFGAIYQKFQPYGWAPSTAHVLWTYPLAWGGMVGGGKASTDTMSFYSGTQYNLKFSYPIIMYGNVYFSLPRGTANTGNGVTCVNLRTGETVWTNPDLASVTFGQLYDFEDPNQHGMSGMYLWATTTVRGTGLTSPNWNNVKNILSGTYAPGTVHLGTTGTSSNNTISVNTQGWVAIYPQNGKLAFNLTDIPSTSYSNQFSGAVQAQGPQGEWLMYNLGREASTIQGTNTPFKYIYEWNNTRMMNGLAGSNSGNYNMSASFDWNVTLDRPLYPTFTSLGSSGGAFAYSHYYNATTGLYTNNPTILRVFPGNLILGQSSGLQQTAATSAGVFGTPDKFVLWAINLNATRGSIGHVMWEKTYDAPDGNKTVLIGPGNAETNVFLLYYRETMQWTGYNMLTGDYMWGPSASENSWNFYGGTTGLTNPYAVGYGRLYAAGHSGTLYCYNLQTGIVEFTYGNSATDPKNSTITTATAYGSYPTQVAAVANNKVYLVEEEHSLNAPAYHGAATRCVDAFSGKELWKIYGMNTWQSNAVADGYFLWLNLNEMQVYCTGPGPSSTSVTANPGVVSNGGSVEITGSVLDQSPNEKLKGTPAIADADQGPWMEYLVQNSRSQPFANGVNVDLTILDSQGNVTDAFTVTSDSSGLFHKLWTPKAEGEYVIYASFQGTDSYGPSSSSTAIGVTAAVAPQPTATPETPTPPPTPTLSPTASPSQVPIEPGEGPPTALYVGIAAVIIVIVIVAAALVLRRRK